MDLFEPWRNAPPARHTLESDSEEEQDPEDVYRQQASSSSSTSRSEPVVKVQWEAQKKPSQGQPLIIAHEEAGMTWSQGLDVANLTLDAYLLLDDQKIGSLSKVADTTLAFIAGSLTYVRMHKVSETLQRELECSSVTCIASYSFSSYLSLAAGDPEICYLSSSGQAVPGAQAFEPPNLVSAFPAALAIEATEQNIPSTTILFPSSLTDSTSSSLPTQGVRRHHIPESIYDYGGPLPGSESLMASSKIQESLNTISTALGWKKLGWNADSIKSGQESARKAKHGASNPAAFGWWEEANRVHQQAIANGGMYI